MSHSLKLRSFRLFIGFMFLFGIVPGNLTTRAQEAQTAKHEAGVNEILSAARIIFIRSKSTYFQSATLEKELLNNAEFQKFDIAITRKKDDADLIIEVERKLFTTHFFYSVIDPRTQRVVASGKVDSIGGTVAGKINKKFVKQLADARNATTPKKDTVK